MAFLALGSCGGEEGSQGEIGEQGEKGDPGAPGIVGDPGAPGATGDPGAQGDPGEDGPPGAQGPSGIMALLGFDDYVQNISTSGVPSHCRTVSHTAGPGEVAALNVQASVQSVGGDVGKLLTARTALSTDGGVTFPTKGKTHMVTYESVMASSSAHVAVSGTFELVEGESYIFGVYLGGGVSTGDVTCTGTVTIAQTL